MFRYGTASVQARTVVLIASIAISALIGLTACGSATVSGAGQTASGAGQSATPAATVSAAAGGSLCAADQRVDRVAVSRIPASSASPGGLLPSAITLRGAAQVRALAVALCALPTLPAGQHCPAAVGESVRLVFAAGQRGFPPITIQESGCRSVTGMGSTRWWQGSPQLGQQLSEAVGGQGRLIPGTHPSSVPTGP
jgi:hypothetical protein